MPVQQCVLERRSLLLRDRRCRSMGEGAGNTGMPSSLSVRIPDKLHETSSRMVFDD